MNLNPRQNGAGAPEPAAPASASEAGNAGWVDTHIHLLPGLDDGPATIEASVAMAETAIADGTTHVVATSHANYQFQYSQARMLELGRQLGTLLDGRLRIKVGCELHLSYENVQAALENPRTYSLNGGRYLLCEFPEFFERASMAGVLERFCGLGLIPVLAHPERNPVFQQTPEALQEYLRLGCLSQVTASSLTGRFGKRAEQFSAEMLDRNWVHLIASDGHAVDRRPPHLSRAHAFLAERQGDEVAQALCSANPLAVMFDRPLAYRPPLEARKRRGLLARLRG